MAGAGDTSTDATCRGEAGERVERTSEANLGTATAAPATATVTTTIRANTGAWPHIKPWDMRRDYAEMTEQK